MNAETGARVLRRLERRDEAFVVTFVVRTDTSQWFLGTLNAETLRRVQVYVFGLHSLSQWFLGALNAETIEGLAWR